MAGLLPGVLGPRTGCAGACDSARHVPGTAPCANPSGHRAGRGSGHGELRPPATSGGAVALVRSRPALLDGDTRRPAGSGDRARTLRLDRRRRPRDRKIGPYESVSKLRRADTMLERLI